MTETAHDPVNRPAHYQGNGLEAIEVMERYELGLHLGNAMKYLLRANRKGRKAEDLAKARWYLNRWLERYQDYLEEEPLPDDDTSLCWRAPEDIADAFGLEGDHRAAAIIILEVAALHDERGPGARVREAIAHLDRAIAMEEAA